MKRIKFYFDKLRESYSKYGLVVTFKEGLFFLIRKKFFSIFIFDAVVYRFLSGRDCQKFIISKFDNSSILPKSRRVVIYVSFSAVSKVEDYVYRQIKEYFDLDYRVLFITASNDLKVEDVNKLKNYCFKIVHRKNIGYDFGSYLTGYDLLKKDKIDFDHLIVTNDSCYGPSYSLSEIIKNAEKLINTVYGMSLSNQIDIHLQSYWFLFNKDLIQGGIVDKYFARLKFLNNKEQVIRYFEIGQSVWLRKQNVKLDALIRYDDIEVKALMKNYCCDNPISGLLGLKLYQDKKIPFIKNSVIRERNIIF